MMADNTQVLEDAVKLTHYRFLVQLRNSGATNMYGAGQYLEEGYGLSRKEASTVLSDWMNTFDLPEDQQPEDGR
jgi:hypothetical protein